MPKQATIKKPAQIAPTGPISKKAAKPVAAKPGDVKQGEVTNKSLIQLQREVVAELRAKGVDRKIIQQELTKLKKLKPVEEGRKVHKKTMLLDEEGKEIVIPDTIRETRGTYKPTRPSRAERPKVSVDICVDAEKNKPWIVGYLGTVIKPVNDTHSSFFKTLVKHGYGSDFPGWYVPNDFYYKLLCKQYANYYVTQAGGQIKITKDGGFGDMGDSDDDVVAINVANLIQRYEYNQQPNLTAAEQNKLAKEETKIQNLEAVVADDPTKQEELAKARQNFSKLQDDIMKKASEKSKRAVIDVIPENLDFQSARKQYYDTLLKSSEQIISEILFQQISDVKPDVYSVYLHVIKKYLGLLENKIGSEKLSGIFFNRLIKEARASNYTIKQLLTKLVSKTLFLRNEFNIFNKNLITKLSKRLILADQLLSLSDEELLPELFLNPNLESQIRKDDLTSKINQLIESAINNLATNIYIALKNQNIKRFKTSVKSLKLPLQEQNEYRMEEHYLGITDLIPIKNLCASRAARDSSTLLLKDEIAESNNFIFYRDEQNRIFCFQPHEIYEIIYNGDSVNPFTGERFNQSFIDYIGKINIKGLIEELQADVFGTSDDELDHELAATIDEPTKDTILEGAEIIEQNAKAELEKSEQDEQVVVKDFYNILLDIVGQLEQMRGNKFSFDNEPEQIIEKPKHCTHCSLRLESSKHGYVGTVQKNKKTGEYNIVHGCIDPCFEHIEFKV